MTNRDNDASFSSVEVCSKRNTTDLKLNSSIPSIITISESYDNFKNGRPFSSSFATLDKLNKAAKLKRKKPFCAYNLKIWIRQAAVALC